MVEGCAVKRGKERKRKEEREGKMANYEVGGGWRI